MDGGVGFGIRTATEGTPDGLLNAIKDIKFFTDDWASYVNKPTPAKMKENPSSIEAVAKNYAVTNIVDKNGNIYYIIARRAYVGFDYGFYKNGMATRPGNYVIDYYAFDSVPESSAYEILYEKALPDSNRFIPKSVQPTVDNAEMREISVGSQAALPVSDKPFDAKVEDSLDKDVIKLFFTYLKAQKEGKKLVVKANKDKALRLTADLYRMLEPDSAKSVRTYINLRSQGVNDSFDIFFIHEDYPNQVYPGLYNYMELDSASMPETDEAKTFAKGLESLVSSSFNANKDDINDTLKWLLMPEYSMVKSLGKQTIDSFFYYCIQPGNFTYESLKDSKGKLNDEFLKVLCPYTKENEKNGERFNTVVKDCMNDASAQNVIALASEYNHLYDLGFNLDNVTSCVKQKVCTQLLSDIKLFKKAIETLTLKGIEKFFVKSIFEGKNDYVGSDVLDSDMTHLYKWFLTQDELSKKSSVLYHRFMKRNMSSNIFISIVDDVYGNDDDAKVKFFIQVLQKELKPFKVVWSYIEHYLEKSTGNYDFLQLFGEKIENEEYSPMFYYAIVKNKPSLTTLDSISKLTNILSRNVGLKQIVEKNYEKDGLYKDYYKKLREVCMENPKESLDSVRKNVVDFLKIKDPSFDALALYLEMVVSDDLSKVKNLSNDVLKLIYDEINEHHNSKLFQELLPNFVDASQKGPITPESLASKYREYNPQVGTIDMMKTLAPTTDETCLDMISAILCKVDHKTFDEALDLVNAFGLNPDCVEKLMKESYERAYNAYKRKNKIKSFFSAIKRIFVRNNDSSKSEQKDSEETDSKEKKKEKDKNKKDKKKGK